MYIVLCSFTKHAMLYHCHHLQLLIASFDDNEFPYDRATDIILLALSIESSFLKMNNEINTSGSSSSRCSKSSSSSRERRVMDTLKVFHVVDDIGNDVLDTWTSLHYNHWLSIMLMAHPLMYMHC